MALDQGLEVFIQLRAQTSTENLSNDEFSVKTIAAAGRINAYRGAQEASANRKPFLSPATPRLSIIPEDGHISSARIDDRSKLPTTSSAPGDDNFLLAHPGSIVPLSLEAQAEIDNSYVSDTASDITAHPSGEAESTANQFTVSPTTQFAIKQADGSYVDVTGEIVIRQPDGSYKELRGIAPWTFQDRENSLQLESQEQAPPEIAPWLYQDDFNAQPPTPTYQTPTSNLGRVNRTGRTSRIVPSKPKHASESIEDFQLANKLRRRSSIPQPVTPGPRTSSLTSLSVYTPYTPSPRSSRLRKISSKLSFSNLRKPSSKFDSPSESESSFQLGVSSSSVIANPGGDSSNPTIGGTPYEEHVFGTAPTRKADDETNLVDNTDPAEDTVSSRKRRGLRPLTIIKEAIDYPFDPLSAMDAIMETPVINVTDTSMTDQYAPRNISTETITPTPTVSNHGRASTFASHQHPDPALSFKNRGAKLRSDAATIFNSPPPLLSDHPINRSSKDAFEINTDYPLMSTRTPALRIKALAKDMNQLSSKTAGFVDDVRKKRSYRNLGGLLARSTPPSQLTFGPELSPIVAAKNAALARSPVCSVPTTPSSIAPTVGSYESRGKRLRKISTFFRKGSKTSDGSLASPATSQNAGSLIKVRDFQPTTNDRSGLSSMEVLKRFKKQQGTGIEEKPTESEHGYIDHFIRNHLAYHKKDSKPGEWPHYPSHPNNPDRAWNHANLRCQTCITGFCSCCGKSCCAYQAMTVRLTLFSRDSEHYNGLKEMLAKLISDTKLRPDPKTDTKELKDTMDALFPSSNGVILGGETQTFLQCTECKKMTCPSCCGICPINGCNDTLCRKCKGEPWGPCKWH